MDLLGRDDQFWDNPAPLGIREPHLDSLSPESQGIQPAWQTRCPLAHADEQIQEAQVETQKSESPAPDFMLTWES